MKFAALIGAALLAAPAAAREPLDVGKWVIEPIGSGSMCNATAGYKEVKSGKTITLSFSFDATRGESRVAFSSTLATSVQNNQKTALNIVFMRDDGSFNDQWGATEFTAIVDNNENRHFVSLPFDKAFMNDAAKADAVAFLVGEKGIASFNLAGSAATIAELRKCAFEVAGLNPDDPFLK